MVLNRANILALVVFLLGLGMAGCAVTATPLPPTPVVVGREVPLTVVATPTPGPTPTPVIVVREVPVTVVATSTPGPTPTPVIVVREVPVTVVATPTPTPSPKIVDLTGMGQQASSKFFLNKGLTIFRMTHDGRSNFAIWLMDTQGERVDLLVNEIGPFDGSKAVGIRNAGSYIFDISADGTWKVRIEQ